MKTIKQTIIEGLIELGFDPSDVEVTLSPQENASDYATNLALKLAKQEKKSPLDLAADIKQQLIDQHLLQNVVEKIEVVKPGFINFYLASEFLYKQLSEIVAMGDSYGQLDVGKDKVVVFDSSHPNIAKQAHVGHLRSTIIGQALVNLYRALGYTVVSDNHLGDWGTGFGKLIAAYRDKYGDEVRDDLSIAEMEELYVDFTRRAKEDESLDERARKELKLLQDGESLHASLWKLFRQKSLDEFEVTIYKPLHAKFDVLYGEAFFYDLPAVTEVYGTEEREYVHDAANLLEKAGIAVESEGALVVPTDNEDEPPMIIRKSDGAYLYATSDLATARFWEKKYKPYKAFYVVAYQQGMHFKHLIEVTEQAKFVRPGVLEHIPFGLVLGSSGKKMSTREGDVVTAAGIIAKAVGKAKAIVQEKNPDLSSDEQDRIAQVIGVGALKYSDLSRDRMTDISFDWDKMMQMSAGSSPYLQYTYARIQSIIEKAGGVPHKASLSLLVEPAEHDLIKQLIRFCDVLQETANGNKPNILALYLEHLGGSFHKFYEQVQILKADDKTRDARLQLIASVATTMKQGLSILGIDVLDRI